MNEHSIPFEVLIKKRDDLRRYPTCEQEMQTSFLLLFLCSFARGIKSVLHFAGALLQAVFHTCLSIVKVIVIAYALALLLPIALFAAAMALILLAVL